jgi:hypothetical protein
MKVMSSWSGAEAPLEEALGQVNLQPLTDASETRAVGAEILEGIPEVPAMSEVEAGGRDESPLGAGALAEHHLLQREEDHGVDGGTTAVGGQLSRPVANKLRSRVA